MTSTRQRLCPQDTQPQLKIYIVTKSIFLLKIDFSVLFKITFQKINLNNFFYVLISRKYFLNLLSKSECAQFIHFIFQRFHFCVQISHQDFLIFWSRSEHVLFLVFLCSVIFGHLKNRNNFSQKIYFQEFYLKIFHIYKIQNLEKR